MLNFPSPTGIKGVREFNSHYTLTYTGLRERDFKGTLYQSKEERF